MAEELAVPCVERRRFRWRLGWKAWSLLLLLALGAGVWWYLTPPEMIPVERIPLPVPSSYSALFNENDPGLTIHLDTEDSKVFLAFDDQGRLQSQIHSFPSYYHQSGAWSPNHRYFACFDNVSISRHARKSIAFFYLYHDGVLLGKTSVPCDEVRVEDSGQVFCWSHNKSDMLYCVKGNRIIAQGKIPRLNPLQSNARKILSPNASGLLVITSQTSCVYYRVAIIGKHITFTQCYIATEPASSFPAQNLSDDPLPILIGDDRVLFNNGALYGPQGKISGSDGWAHLYQPFPGDSAVVQQRQIAGQSGVEYRSFNVRTGEYWILPHTPPHHPLYFICSTQDGHRVLYANTENPNASLPILKYLMNLIPKSNTTTSYLYEHPGRCRASMRISLVEDGAYYTDPHTRVRYLIVDARFSPDGHSLFAIMSPGTGVQGQRELWRFRW